VAGSSRTFLLLRGLHCLAKTGQHCTARSNPTHRLNFPVAEYSSLIHDLG